MHSVRQSIIDEVRMTLGKVVMTRLRDRFEAFVKTLGGFESIDALLRVNDPDGKQRADYLFSARTVIVEQKILDVDPASKTQAFLERVMKERGIGGYGLISSNQIFSKLPDGEEVHRKFILRVTGVVEQNVSKADKQTRDTREIFGISDAAGILVLLNEKAYALAPDVVAYRMAHTFERKNPDGSLQYPHNDGAIIISEAHPVKHPLSSKAFPMMAFLASHRRRSEKVTQFANELMERWAAFNNAPVVYGDWQRLRSTHRV